MQIKNEPSKSWFCEFNNPELHGFDGTPDEIVDKIIEVWIKDNPQRTCAVAYCVSALGLKHLHCVLEDKKSVRFSAIKKLYHGMNIQPTKGNKQQADDYINKRGKWEEKGEKIVLIKYNGEIQGKQGKRNDIEAIDEFIQQGLTPNEIFDISLAYRKFEKITKDAYYRKRYLDTPPKREIKIYWHFGKSGTGKSHTYIKLSEKYGEENIYRVSEYTNGFMDKYSGEKILFMDELRSDSLPYTLLLTMTDVYKSQIHSRYTNTYCLWNEVHITSIFPPDVMYKQMFYQSKNDTYKQLKRRISYMIYHYIENDKYLTKEIPMSEYKKYTDFNIADDEF
ncbi:MAG: hypothetical protein LBM96_06995 [Methanobrevibacter sp.]|nr:hypothetical protein [Candidatus Methanoflexus mossambicus]